MVELVAISLENANLACRICVGNKCVARIPIPEDKELFN